MTEVAPSDLMNAPLASLTPEQAGARRASLMATPEFTKAAIEGDVGKQEMLRDLWMLERGHQPASLRPPSNAADVHEGMSDKEIELDRQRVETWGKFIDNFDDVKRATIQRGLCTQQEHDEAVRELARMKKDRAFGARVLAGDNAAGDAWARVNLVASMQVAPDDYKW